MKPRTKSSRNRLLTVIPSIALIAAAIAVRATLVEPIRIYSRSMEPTFYEGDWILVRLVRADGDASMRLDTAKSNKAFVRGDVIVFRTSTFVMATSPDDTVAVKRIAAVAGDTVDSSLGRIYVNGKPYMGAGPSAVSSFSADKMSNPVGDDSWKPEWARLKSRNEGTQIVPPGHVYVLGDNLPRSVDSRRFGAIPTSVIKGRVILRHFGRKRRSL